MTTDQATIDKAAQVIYDTLSGKYGDFCHHDDAAQALADAGLLADANLIAERDQVRAELVADRDKWIDAFERMNRIRERCVTAGNNLKDQRDAALKRAAWEKNLRRDTEADIEAEDLACTTARLNEAHAKLDRVRYCIGDWATGRVPEGPGDPTRRLIAHLHEALGDEPDDPNAPDPWREDD